MDKETLKMFSELLDSKLGDLENRLDSKLGALEKRLEYKLDKNTTLLENLKVKVESIEEIQKLHMAQNQKEHNDIINSFSDKIDVIDFYVKDTSKDVKENKNGLFNVELITSSNWNEIVKLKAVR